MCLMLVLWHCCIVQLGDDRGTRQLCDLFMLLVTVEMQSKGIVRVPLPSKVYQVLLVFRVHL